MDETLAPRALAGVAVPLLDALPLLAAMTAAETDRAPASVAVWSLAAPRACLADDMGLGKTIQLLAFLLHRRAACPEDRRRALLVCPTSVVGHWEREVTRFAPSLPVVRHYGPDRARSAAALESAPPGAMVVTTYGLLRRDAEILADRWWNPAVEDQATDRAYRIGQRRAVQVHKLLTAGTVVRRALYWLPED
jgi:SNF2 family DNA or RNA helicase